MKALKIVGSILLVLVLVAGTYVGIITKGFRKWKNLKTEKQKVVNFYNNGKTGIPSDDYQSLANENEKLAKTVDDLSENNSKLLSDKTTLTNQVDNLTEEKNTLLEKNSELQNIIKENEERSQYLTTDYYVGMVDEIILVRLINGSESKTFNRTKSYGQVRASEFKELYDFFLNCSDIRLETNKTLYIYKVGLESMPISVITNQDRIMYANSNINEKKYSVAFDESFTEDEKTSFLNGDTGFSCYIKYDVEITSVGSNKVDVNFTFNISKNGN